MASNRSDLLNKFKLILILTIALVASVTFVMCVIIQPWVTPYLNDPNAKNPIDVITNNKLIISVFLAAVFIFSGLISEIIVRSIEYLLKKKKGDLHGWWFYCFLFPATDVDLNNFVCFLHKGEKKVLVVGFMKVYQDPFNLYIEHKRGTSKTFAKGDNKLHSRVHLEIKNIDFRDTNLVVVYQTVKSPFVQEYRGIMDWHGRVDTILIHESLSAKPNFYHNDDTLSYLGLIQDLEPNQAILENSIYLQHLRYEKNAKDVEAILEKNAHGIFDYVKESYNASLVP